MSDWVDAFLEALWEHGAESLVLKSGVPPALRFGNREQPVSRQSLALDHLTTLVRRAGGRDLWQTFESMGTASWTEARPGRRFRFVAQGDLSRSLRIDITPEKPDAVPVRGDSPAELSTPPATSPAAAAPAPSVRAPAPTSALACAVASGVAPAEPVAPAAVAPPSELAPGPIQIVEELLRRTHGMRASDLHLTSDMPPLVRLDGRMQPLEGYGRLRPEALRELLRSVTPERNALELERMWDTDFAHEIPGVARFRVNLFHDRLGVGGVFRVIPDTTPKPQDLGLPVRLIEMTQLSKGIVLVTGPTGSGKSTTLSALLDHINDTRHDHVITIEDPIEFVHRSRNCLINQREVGTHAQTFKRALREALREDPDIVLVGEMRDLETVHIALETAETGHLVFATLHTNSAPASIDRLIDQFPAAQQQQIRVMLADSLRCVAAQVLCRRKTGGRVAALELMVCTPAIANLIREGKTHQIPSIMQTTKAEGMQLMTEALVNLVKEGTIDPEEALARATDRDDVWRTLERAGLLPNPLVPKPPTRRH